MNNKANERLVAIGVNADKSLGSSLSAAIDREFKHASITVTS